MLSLLREKKSSHVPGVHTCNHGLLKSTRYVCIRVKLSRIELESAGDEYTYQPNKYTFKIQQRFVYTRSTYCSGAIRTTVYVNVRLLETTEVLPCTHITIDELL